MALTSQLDAVNIIIGTIGEAPLNTLDNKALTSDATVAVRLLDEVSRAVQISGWSFNTDRDYTFARDTSGNIFLPDNVLRVVFDPYFTSRTMPVVRGRQLYDTVNRTYTFTQDIKTREVIWLFDWDELPESARHYVTVRAARIFTDRQGGGNEVHSYTQEYEIEAKRDFERDESGARHLNIFNAEGPIRILNRRSPWVS